MPANVVVGAEARALVGPVDRERSRLSIFRAGFMNMRQGWESREVWRTLALNDVSSRYRRTFIGPFWMTIQMAVWVVGLTILYSQLFHTDIQTLVPFIAIGLLMWTFLSGMTTDGSGVFIAAAGYLKSSSLPVSSYAYQLVTRQLVFFLHSLAIVVLLLVATGTRPTLAALWSAPLSLALAFVNGFLVAIWLGIAAARYRDIQPLIIASMNVLMFLTPIFWSPEQLGRPGWMLAWNPFSWYVVTFREGLIGAPTTWSLWVLILIATVVNVLVAAFVLGKSRRLLAYWV